MLSTQKKSLAQAKKKKIGSHAYRLYFFCGTKREPTELCAINTVAS